MSTPSPRLPRIALATAMTLALAGCSPSPEPNITEIQAALSTVVGPQFHQSALVINDKRTLQDEQSKASEVKFSATVTLTEPLYREEEIMAGTTVGF